MEKSRKIVENLVGSKMIVLVRDPRAVFHSRWSDEISAWCKDPKCSDPETSCQDILEDVLAAKDMIKKFPGWYKLYIRSVQGGGGMEGIGKQIYEPS